MDAKENNNYGSVYEIKLNNNQYVYVCWMAECSFGIFDYMGKDKLDPINLDKLTFKIYKACKENGIKRKIWEKVYYCNLQDKGIQFPDLVIFREWNKEESLELSQIMRNGNLIKIKKEDYLVLLKKGYIYGYFDDFKKFEQWILNNFKDYPHNILN